MSLLTVGAQQLRAEGKEELFQAATVLEALAQKRDQVLGDVHATAALALGEGEDAGGVFVAAGAGGAVFSDTGLFDESQRAFERRPESGQLGEEGFLELRQGIGFDVHVVCIYYYIHTMQGKE